MKRRAFIAALGGAAAWPLAASAQQAIKIARIGYLASNLANQGPLEAFRQGLRDLGYVEGRNVMIEYRDAQGKLEPLQALAAELVALKVDVIVASSTAAALAAKQATTVVPIVFGTVPDPVATGLVASLARPGGNVTGLSISTRTSSASPWNISRRPFRGLVGLRSFGSQVPSGSAQNRRC